LVALANYLGNEFAEASCLGEHEVAVSGKKKFISRRFQNLTEPYRPPLEAQFSSGARLRYAPPRQECLSKEIIKIYYQSG